MATLRRNMLWSGLALALALCVLPRWAGAASPTLTVTIKNISDNATVATMGWSSVTQNWVASNQYLQVDYTNTVTGWGIQIYTNNHAGDGNPANPAYTGVQTQGYEGVGLIGVTNSTLYCSTAWAAYDSLPGTPPAAPAVSGTIPNGSVWSWMKDAMQTGAYLFVPGDSYITFVNGSGVTLDNTTARGAATSPVFVYLTADFGGKPNQTYQTNQLTIELYHQ